MIRTLALVALAVSRVAFSGSPDPAAPMHRECAPGMAAQDPGDGPGPEHARLAMLAGDWTVTTTFRFGDAPPQEFHGKAHAAAILGGRFVQFDETGVEFGQAVERQKVFGFNAAARRYESTWRYTGSTAVMNLSGASSDAGKTIAGDATFAGTGGEAQKFTWDLVQVDADTLSSTLVAAAGEGKPKATFAAIYKRQRAGK